MEGMMKRRSFLRMGAGAVMGGALSACGGNGDDGGGTPAADPPDPPAPPPVQAPVQAASGTTVAGWTRVALQAVRDAKPGPPMAARSFAVMYTCMYNAWCAYDQTAKPTRTTPAAQQALADCTLPNKAMAMSYAAHAALSDQFPTERQAFDAYLASLGYGAAGNAAGGPAALGIAVARAEIEYCHADGANQLGDLTPSGVPYADYTGYAPQNPPMIVSLPTTREGIAAPGHWQPLTYADAGGVLRTPVFLAAAWERIRPFALTASDQYRPGPPPAYGSPGYVDEVEHIIEVQASLNDEQKVIAEYWADAAGSDLAPGHWLRFALYVSERDRHTDDQDIKMFLALASALGDAAIAAWDAKRAYDSVRPITAVRYLKAGQTIRGYGLPGTEAGVRSVAGEIWLPYQPSTFPTPPFPEYVSGHSCFSAAAAEVLRSFTGSEAFGASASFPAHSAALEAGVPAQAVTLGWASFSAAAEQAGISRVYGGIHFDPGNAAGQTLGRKVGGRAYAKARRLWQGGT
jgi:hypothetical protein